MKRSFFILVLICFPFSVIGRELSFPIHFRLDSVSFSMTSFNFHSQTYHDTTAVTTLDSSFFMRDIFLLSEDSIYIRNPANDNMSIRAKYSVDSSKFNIIITKGSQRDTNALIKLRNDSLLMCNYQLAFWRSYINSNGTRGSTSGFYSYSWNDPADKFDSLKATMDSSTDSISLRHMHGIYTQISNISIHSLPLSNRDKIISGLPKLVLTRSYNFGRSSNYYNLQGKKIKIDVFKMRPLLRPAIAIP